MPVNAPFNLLLQLQENFPIKLQQSVSCNMVCGSRTRLLHPISMAVGGKYFKVHYRKKKKSLKTYLSASREANEQKHNDILTA